MARQSIGRILRRELILFLGSLAVAAICGWIAYAALLAAGHKGTHP